MLLTPQGSLLGDSRGGTLPLPGLTGTRRLSEDLVSQPHYNPTHRAHTVVSLQISSVCFSQLLDTEALSCSPPGLQGLPHSSVQERNMKMSNYLAKLSGSGLAAEVLPDKVATCCSQKNP